MNERFTRLDGVSLSCPLALGTGGFSGVDGGYSFGPIEEKEVENTLFHALARGMEVIDTAPLYGFGAAEKRLGKLLTQKRNNVFLVSKAGLTWHGSGRVNLDNRAKTCEKMLHQSLKDLKTDVIDAYLIHYPDPRVDIRSSYEVLAKAKLQGKVRFIGLSNTNPEEIKLAAEVDTIDIIQQRHNFFDWQFANQKASLSECFNSMLMGYGTLDQGILTKRAVETRKYHPADQRSHSPSWKKRDVLKDIKRVEKLEQLLLNTEYSLLDAAISSSLSHEQLDVALLGAKSEKEIDGYFNSLEKLASFDEVKKWQERVGG